MTAACDWSCVPPHNVSKVPHFIGQLAKVRPMAISVVAKMNKPQKNVRWCSMTTPMIAFNGEFVFIHSILVGSAFGVRVWLDSIHIWEIRARLTISTHRYRHEYNNNEYIYIYHNVKPKFKWPGNQLIKRRVVALFVLVCRKKKRKKKVLNSWCRHRQSLQISFLFSHFESCILLTHMQIRTRPNWMAKTSKLRTDNETKKIWENLKVTNWANAPIVTAIRLFVRIECGTQGDIVGESNL